MNTDIWTVSQTILDYIVENPNNDQIFQRAESYGQVLTACFLTGIDVMSLEIQEVETALKISRLANNLDVFRLAVKIYEYQVNENPSALDLLANAEKRHCVCLCLNSIMLIPTKEITNDYELYAAVSIARLLEELYNA